MTYFGPAQLRLQKWEAEVALWAEGQSSLRHISELGCKLRQISCIWLPCINTWMTWIVPAIAPEILQGQSSRSCWWRYFACIGGRWWGPGCWWRWWWWCSLWSSWRFLLLLLNHSYWFQKGCTRTPGLPESHASPLHKSSRSLVDTGSSCCRWSWYQASQNPRTKLWEKWKARTSCTEWVSERKSRHIFM